jgi:hypothetical protein
LIEDNVRALTWFSWLSVAAAILTAAIALFSQYAVRSESLGAHNLGTAIDSSFVLAVALVGSLYAVPALVVIGAIAWFFQRQSGYRFFAAAAICVLPLVVASFI